MGDVGDMIGGDVGGGMANDLGLNDIGSGMGDAFGMGDGTDMASMMGLNDIGSGQGSFGGGVTPSGNTTDVANNPVQAQDAALDPGNQLPNQLPPQPGAQPGQAPQQAPPGQQQGGMLDWLRSMQNPNAWTPGGTAQAADLPGGANFDNRFGKWNTLTTGVQDASITPEMAQRSGMLPDQLQQAPANPNLTDASFNPATYAPSADQVTGVAPASQTVIPGAAAGGDAGAIPDTTTPDRTPDQTPPSQGGGGRQGGQPDQGDQGGQGDRQGDRQGGGNPLERLLRRAGFSPSLARLAAMAAASGMLGGRGRGRGFPGFGRFGRGGRGFRHGLPVGGPFSHRFPGMSRMPGTPRFQPLRPQGGGGVDPSVINSLLGGDGGQQGGQQAGDQPDRAAPGQGTGAQPDTTQAPPDATEMPPQRDATGALVVPSEAGGPDTAAPAQAPAQRPAPPAPGQAPRGPFPGAGIRSNVANTLHAGGLSQNAVGGVMANISSESGWNPGSRVADQPRFSGEAHYAHGLYQEGGTEWNNYQRWLQQKGMDWRTAWKNPVLQSQFLTENLKRNYPRVWQAMNNAATPAQAAEIFMRGYLRPAQLQAMRRSLEYRRGVPSALQQLAMGAQQ